MLKTLLLTCILVATTANAQVDDLIEILRSDVKTSKIGIITRAMSFNEKESAAFWPVHRKYDFELSKIGDRRLKLIKDYAESYENMTNEKATALIKRWFDIQEDETELREEYFERFAEILSPKAAARWLQVENQIDLMIDLQISSSVPLVK